MDFKLVHRAEQRKKEEDLCVWTFDSIWIEEEEDGDSIRRRSDNEAIGEGRRGNCDYSELPGQDWLGLWSLPPHPFIRPHHSQSWYTLSQIEDFYCLSSISHIKSLVFGIFLCVIRSFTVMSLSLSLKNFYCFLPSLKLRVSI